VVKREASKLMTDIQYKLTTPNLPSLRRTKATAKRLWIGEPHVLKTSTLHKGLPCPHCPPPSLQWITIKGSHHFTTNYGRVKAHYNKYHDPVYVTHLPGLDNTMGSYACWIYGHFPPFGWHHGTLLKSYECWVCDREEK
jgi:hypothetical protein